MEDDQLGEEDVVFLDDKWVSNPHNFCASVYSLQHVWVLPENYLAHRRKVMDWAHQFWNTKFHQTCLKYFVTVSVNSAENVII